jgi:ribosomal protein S1
MVKVLGVDRERKRISLSMKDKAVQPEGDTE